MFWLPRYLYFGCDLNFSKFLKEKSLANKGILLFPQNTKKIQKNEREKKNNLKILVILLLFYPFKCIATQTFLWLFSIFLLKKSIFIAGWFGFPIICPQFKQHKNSPVRKAYYSFFNFFLDPKEIVYLSLLFLYFKLNFHRDYLSSTWKILK